MTEIISPAQLFEEWGPEWMEDMFSPPALIEEVCFTIQIEITGEGGGIWCCTFDLGDYQYTKGPASETPLLTVRSTRDAWDQDVGRWLPVLRDEIERAGGPEALIEQLLEAERSAGRPEIRLTEKKLNALKQHPTHFRCEATQEGESSLSVDLGSWTRALDGAPDFIVKADAASYQAMRERTLHPLDAWTQKKISIEGKLALALKLGNIIK